MNFKTCVFLVLSLTVLVILVFSFFQPPSSYQELRRAILVKENARDFKVFQTYNGEPYFTKPPLYTWLASVFVKPFSSTPEGMIFPLRVFSVLCYVLLFLSLIRFYQKDWQSAFFL
uniref:Glycosyltransferase RgtA/B/C/D-like domain-containing protein n=1 Tax=Thermodesulfobacterium geofontis TaxID=1295609 RepID=A0A7V5XH16_9BACT